MLKYLLTLPCLILCFSNLYSQNLLSDGSLSAYGTPGSPWSTNGSAVDYHDPSAAVNDPRPVGACEQWIDFDGIAGNNASQDGGSSIGGTTNENLVYDLTGLGIVPGDSYNIYFEYANPGLDDCGTIVNGDGFWRFRLASGTWRNGPELSVGTTGTMQWLKGGVNVTAGTGTTLRIQARRVSTDTYIEIDNIVLVPECSTDLGSPALTDCYSLGCYPTCNEDAQVLPGSLNTNPADCDIDPNEPSDAIEIPTFACGGANDETPVTFETTILPTNPSVLYHYWGNCAPLSPYMPENIEPPANGYIQQMFCETDAFGLPAFPGGLSGENGIINFLPQSSLDVGCNGFADVGTCDCGGSSQDEKTAELIQLDFWLAVPNIQSQVGFQFSGGQQDAGSFFAGADLSNMCEVAFYTDGPDHGNQVNQPTATFNIVPGQLSETCGLSWLRIRLYINDIADQFTVSPEINVGNGWGNIDQLLVVPALSADDNTVPTVATTPVNGYLIEEGGEQFLYDAGGTWDPYGCNPASATDVGICGAQCPAVNPIDVKDGVCDGMLGSTITDWMTSVESNTANIAAIADANTVATVVYSLDVNPTEVTPPAAGTADASHSGIGCGNETETTYAYLLCYGADATVGGGDDVYLLVGTHVLTVYPPAQQATDNIVTCFNTPIRFCTDDTFDAVASNATGGADIANWDGTSYTSQAGDLAGTVDIVVVTANACTATFTINTPACSAACPATIAEDDTDAICDGILGTEVSSWQSAVAMTNATAIGDINTAAALEYSSTLVDGAAVLTPDGNVADGTWTGPGCANETQTTYAYLLCYGDDATLGGGDDTYLLIGTHVLTIFPSAQQPKDAIVTCVNTPVSACSDETFSTAASNPTGGADIANWNGTSYTSQAGDLAGSVDIVVATANACTATFTINTPACSAACPATIPEDDSDSICDGTLGTEVSSWQSTVATTNAAAIGHTNTAAALEYSSTLVDGTVLVPDGIVADGIWTGPGCANETQTTYAYLLCYGEDATLGGGDDTYLLIGTHVLTIYPPAQQPADGIVACINTPMGACSDDTFSTAASNPTGGADIANWNGTSYTSQPGDLAGTVDIVVTTTNGCTDAFTFDTPSCICEDISGQVFLDSDNSACQEVGELSAMTGITVRLFTCGDDPNTDTPLGFATVTDGTYSFSDMSIDPNAAVCLDANLEYFVTVELANGTGEPLEDFQLSTGNPNCIGSSIADDIDATTFQSDCYNPSDIDSDDGDADNHINVGVFLPCKDCIMMEMIITKD